MTCCSHVPLSLECIPCSRLGEQGSDWHASVLGGVGYAHPAITQDRIDWPLLAVDMRLPQNAEPICATWRCSEPLTDGQHGEIRYRHGDTLLFGCLTLTEPAAAAEQEREPLQAVSEAAYRHIFQLLADSDFSTVLRFWNYFPAINRETREMERYRQFNVGRQDAFLAQGRSVIDNVPAACALGSAGGGLQIAFLASRVPAVSIENPRQISAYHYPSQYGPRSPSFSRAGLVDLSGRPMLFISGTASIVGHASMHVGDVLAQTRESMRNIASVVEQANLRAPQAPFRLVDLAYTVYVRRAEDIAGVRREMVSCIGSEPRSVFLQADVCRADLLVEIEASGGHGLAGAN
jgi:chorismate lyase / 3-hydroxybenzoate synthase